MSLQAVTSQLLLSFTSENIILRIVTFIKHIFLTFYNLWLQFIIKRLNAEKTVSKIVPF